MVLFSEGIDVNYNFTRLYHKVKVITEFIWEKGRPKQ